MSIARRLASTLAFGAAVATCLTFVGTRDLENYDHAVFSLDRGTAVEFVRVLGQPVYTTALGFGVRLPLHGNLAASPAAAVAPFVALPIAYWLLITFSISAAVMVVRSALEPLAGRLISWLAVVLLFWSVPMVSYTIYNDWPETAVTYCAIVICVFAPQAYLALCGLPSAAARRFAALSLAATVWGAVALSHPGYSQLLACSLVLAVAVAMCRSEYPLRTRVAAAAVLGAAALAAALVPLADVWREMRAAGEAADSVTRVSVGPSGDLLPANMFPLGEIGNRLPFMLLPLTVVSLAIALGSRDAHLRWPIIGSGIASIALGIGATSEDVSESLLAPSAVWVLRDPAAAFGVFSAACAAHTLRDRHVASRAGSRFFRAGWVAPLLVLTVLQGPTYATHLYVAATRPEMTTDEPPWNRDWRPPGARIAMLGLPPAAAGERIALWPGMRETLRGTWRRSTDLADAGYALVTASTKQRTMRGLVEPNVLLFNQTTDLPEQLLCDPTAIEFLRLRYLLMPDDASCDAWGVLPEGPEDLGIEARSAPETHPAVWALPRAQRSAEIVREPALSGRSSLIPALVRLPATLLAIDTGTLRIRLDDASAIAGHTLVFPVAYDAAWRTSSGHLESVGGLLAMTGAGQADVTIDFRPDAFLWLRAAGTVVAQIMALAGFVGLAAVQPGPP